MQPLPCAIVAVVEDRVDFGAYKGLRFRAYGVYKVSEVSGLGLILAPGETWE